MSDLAIDSPGLRAVVENLPAAVIIVAADSGRVLLTNRPVEELLGPEIATGTLSWPDDVDAYRPDGTEYAAEDRPIARALRGDRVGGEIVDVRLPDGRRGVYAISAGPIRSEDGVVVAAVMTLMDVSAEHARQRAEREFVTNAAHELRTPLTAITSAVEVLQAGAKERPEERDVFLGHLEVAVARLGRLTHALLVLARAQTQVEAPKTEVVAVDQLVRATLDGIEVAPDVAVEVTVAPELAVVANRALVEQALGAVVANAARYTDEGRIEIRAQRDDRFAKLVVRDTGIGFPSELADRVLDRFARGGELEREGFGLGLAIARQSLEAVGGTLGLESELGEGTTATITLPGAAVLAR